MSDKAGDYGPASKLLHRLALASPLVAEACLDLEEALYGRGLPAAGDGAHVFVTGLARAGTTMLMRLLHGSGAFCSLTYRDMPFVLAPNAWARLTRLSRRDLAARERAHGDGVVVDADSPEALDEVFWRVHCGGAYIGPRTLRPMQADAEVLDRLRAYVALVLRRYGAGRYLSKNNNNVLRLPSIRRAFPRAALLVPFRDPVQQARSLLTQHRRFAARQRESAFARAYMGWLAHHEFGLDHRPFALPGVAPDAGDGGDAEHLSCWLRQWLAAYGYLWRQARDGAVEPIFVGYEALCRQPARVCDALAARLDVPRETLRFEARESRTTTPPDADHALLARARDLYAALQESSRAALPA